jgi:hypothetical protein
MFTPILARKRACWASSRRSAVNSSVPQAQKRMGGNVNESGLAGGGFVEIAKIELCVVEEIIFGRDEGPGFWRSGFCAARMCGGGNQDQENNGAVSE